jgi:hypothetical protein
VQKKLAFRSETRHRAGLYTGRTKVWRESQIAETGGLYFLDFVSGGWASERNLAQGYRGSHRNSCLEHRVHHHVEDEHLRHLDGPCDRSTRLQISRCLYFTCYFHIFGCVREPDSKISEMPLLKMDPTDCQALSDDVLAIVFQQLGEIDPQTLHYAVPAVCRSWRDVCKLVLQFDIDLKMMRRMRADEDHFQCVAGVTAIVRRFHSVRMFSLALPSASDAGVAAVAAGCPN